MTLDCIVGQAATAQVARWLAGGPAQVANWLFEGPPGVGKSMTALTVARHLAGQWGTHVVPASELSIDAARGLWGGPLRLRPIDGHRWQCLVIEELELLPSKTVVPYLKTMLGEGVAYPHVVVLATSNDATGLDAGLADRFRRLRYWGDVGFARAFCRQVVAPLLAEKGVAPPRGERLEDWGWVGQNGARVFSGRRALARLHEYLQQRSVA